MLGSRIVKDTSLIVADGGEQSNNAIQQQCAQGAIRIGTGALSTWEAKGDFGYNEMALFRRITYVPYDP